MSHREADDLRLDYERRARAWTVWHIVALDRTKRLPPLRDLLGPVKERRPQTWQDQMRIVQQLNAAFGGSTSSRADHA